MSHILEVCQGPLYLKRQSLWTPAKWCLSPLLSPPEQESKDSNLHDHIPNCALFWGQKKQSIGDSYFWFDPWKSSNFIFILAWISLPVVNSLSRKKVHSIYVPIKSFENPSFHSPRPFPLCFCFFGFANKGKPSTTDMNFWTGLNLPMSTPAQVSRSPSPASEFSSDHHLTWIYLPTHHLPIFFWTPSNLQMSILSALAASVCVFSGSSHKSWRSPASLDQSLDFW